MADHEALVEEIKNVQRQGGDAKQAWWDYADSQLGGVRDPKRHDASVLAAFLDNFPASVSSPRGGGMPGASRRTFAGNSPANGGLSSRAASPAPNGAGGTIDLASFIKTGQRKSGAWKSAWQAYCHSQGSQYYDPAKFDEPFIAGFIDYAGQCVQAQLGSMGGGMMGDRSMFYGGGGGMMADRGMNFGGRGGRGDMGMGYGGKAGRMGERGMDFGGKGSYPKRSSDGMGAPPAKRANTGLDPEKADLVSRVKDLQRRDEQTKELWWSMCDQEHGGIRDPARLPDEVLMAFISQNE